METLTTSVAPGSESFVGNEAEHRALLVQLREKLATAALGGPERSRQRHLDRGKLLPRERIDQLLDEGSPFWKSPRSPPTGSTMTSAPEPG